MHFKRGFFYVIFSGIKEEVEWKWGLTQSDCFAIQFCMELHSGKKCIVIEKKMQLLRANWNSFLLKTFLQSDIFKVDNLEANRLYIQRNVQF